MSLDFYTCYYNESLLKVYEDFRGGGLRHMLVLSYRNDVVGMVTRKDLALLHCGKDREGLGLKFWVYPSRAVQKGKRRLQAEEEEETSGNALA